MPEEIIVNVTQNVTELAIALAGAYAAMFVLEILIRFAGNMFAGIKLFSSFKIKKGDEKTWDI